MIAREFAVVQEQRTLAKSDAGRCHVCLTPEASGLTPVLTGLAGCTGRIFAGRRDLCTSDGFRERRDEPSLRNGSSYSGIPSGSAVRSSLGQRGGALRFQANPVAALGAAARCGAVQREPHPSWDPLPPLFLPSLGAALEPPTALPKAPPPISVGSAPVSADGTLFAEVPASSCPPAPHSALPAPAAAKAVPSQSSPTLGEPQTPELAPATLRSLEPAPAAAPEACFAPAAAAVPQQLSAPTVVGRPIAIRPVLLAGAAGAPVPSRPLAVATPPPMYHCESPPSIPSPGAAFSVVVKPMPVFLAPPQQQHLQLAPHPAATPAAAVPLPASPAGLVLKTVLAPAPCSKGAGGRKRRSMGPGSPPKRRAGSPDSVTEEGCGDSMERATGYKGRFCGRLFLKVPPLHSTPASRQNAFELREVRVAAQKPA